MKARPNILVVAADQLSAQALPAYGNPDVATANIDRVLGRGVRFGTCYTPCPLCQPARAAYWTGRWPHQTGVLSNGRKHPVPPVPDDMPTLGALFRDAGYETVHFGKTHDAGSLRGFEVVPAEQAPLEGTAAWPVNYDSRQDVDTTAKAVAYLRGRPRRPFLAVVDLNNPHNICGWVGENAGAHGDEPIPGPLPPLPDNFRARDFERLPRPVQYICCSHNRQAQTAGWNETNFRHYLAAYYHYVGRLDGCVGAVLDALEGGPGTGDTLVVFMVDHGDSMAGRGMVTKQVSFYDETTRVPLAFAGPGVVDDGRQLDAPLVSLLDLLPTLCDAAGIAAPRDLWGRSLGRWLGGDRHGSPHDYLASEWHTEWGFTIEPGRMIRTPGWKYTRYLEGDGEQLYDLAADPGEIDSRIGEPACAGVLDEHRRLLAEHVRQTGDPFFELSWVADPRWRSHPAGYRNHRGPAASMLE